MKRLLLLALLASLGCGPKHIETFTPKEREYKVGKYAVDQASSKPTQGSLYSEAVPSYLEDTRAHRSGDIVIVQIDEHADAVGNATTKLDKSSSSESGIDALYGLLPALKSAYPDLDPAKLLALASKSQFNGDGKTSRAGQLTGKIGVRVRQTLPNGDLLIEGTKVVMINDEEIHLYVSGVIRPEDIKDDNSVESSRMADAQVEYSGRGDVADTLEQGWLSQALSYISPF
ncbi:MAG: flagellar basal body L-ring protein FlgH [Polyangiaceae bacterium]|nr:flagellar basal body L-ring protein FlgH [Polyangiaceae bacterium]